MESTSEYSTLRSLFNERNNGIFPRKIAKKKRNKRRFKLRAFENVIIVWMISSSRKIKELCFLGT